MAFISQDSTNNILLRSLDASDYALLAPHLERVPLDIGNVIAAAGEPIEWAWFPEAGIISFADILTGGSQIGIGHLGYEGFAGWPVLLGCHRSSHHAEVTVSGGSALRIDGGRLADACRASHRLSTHLLCFVQAFFVQLGRTVVSNLTQPVEPRLCRWILMGHDRLAGDEIEVTHNQVGIMLGVRRASVTDALHILEGDGLIRCSRGLIVVRDREGLRKAAGETYGYAEAEYSRLIAPFGKDG